MPRYLFDLATSDRETRERATRLATQRFPELEIEHSYVLHDEHGNREVWVCRAPSEAHLHRWATAADITLGTVQRVDADAAPS